MKNTVLAKIENLKESLIRKDSMQEVESQVKDIFSIIDSMQNKEEKHQAMDAMMDIAIFLMGEIGKFQVSDILKALGAVGVKNKKVQSINVQVSRYIDVDLVEIDKRVPYSELCTILNKVREGFESSIEDAISISYNKEKELIEFDYLNKKDLAINISPWNLSDESIDIYIEGFVEYISK